MTDSVPLAGMEKEVAELIGTHIIELPPGFGSEDDLFALGLDSMAIMQLLLALEEGFGIAIPVESVSRQNFSTVSAISGMVMDRGGSPLIAPAEPPAEPPARQEQSAPAALKALPLQGCDYFVYSFDAMSRRTGQGGHKAHTVIELAQLPDVKALSDRLQRAASLYPMLNARLRRPSWFRSPEWHPSVQASPSELSLFSEEGSPGRLLAHGARLCADATQTLTEIVNTPLPIPSVSPKVRFSLLERRDGSVLLVFSWSHLVLDGMGAELLLEDLSLDFALTASGALAQWAEPPRAGDRKSLRERWQACRPVIETLNRLASHKVGCLGPVRSRPGRTLFEVRTLDAARTREAARRCETLGGGLGNMPFYLASAARAHDRVFLGRGIESPAYACSVPVQLRRKGSRGPIFQNHVTMFFGVLRRAEMESLEAASISLVAQHAEFARERLGESLNTLMELLRPMPPSLYWQFITSQMKGPFASFFHSHTGEFAPGLQSFLGAQIVNAYHIPGIATPPGTGLFCNEKNGRLTITLCWHEDALSAEERQLLFEQFEGDICGS